MTTKEVQYYCFKYSESHICTHGYAEDIHFENKEMYIKFLIDHYKDTKPYDSISSFDCLTKSNKIEYEELVTVPPSGRRKKPKQELQKKERWELVFDYKEYNCTESKFLERNRSYYKEKYKGFYKLEYGQTELDVKENHIIAKAQLFARFYTANIVNQFEVKEAGKPYQPAKEEVIITETSELYPIYYIKGDHPYRKAKYSLASGIDEWYKDELYYPETQIYLNKNTIKVVESL